MSRTHWISLAFVVRVVAAVRVAMPRVTPGSPPRRAIRGRPGCRGSTPGTKAAASASGRGLDAHPVEHGVLVELPGLHGHVAVGHVDHDRLDLVRRGRSG